jgi:hypothetical protein
MQKKSAVLYSVNLLGRMEKNANLIGRFAPRTFRIRSSRFNGNHSTTFHFIGNVEGGNYQVQRTYQCLVCCICLMPLQN